MGLWSDPQGHMSLDQPGLDALFRIWATAGCGVVRSGLARIPWARGGRHSAGPRFFFKAPLELPPGWFDESEVQRYTATPSSMLALCATISAGGNHKKAKASAATAAAAPKAMAPSPFVQPSVVQAVQGVRHVCSSSTVVSAGSTVRLNRFHPLQPCTVERHLPTHRIASPHFCGSPASLLSLQLTASDVPEHMFVVGRRGPGIVVRGRWPPMPIVEWWDLWYRQIPGVAQVVRRMSRGVQRGLRELSNAGQGSPAPERQRSTPLESSPAVITAPQPSPVEESFEEFYKSVWDHPSGAGAASKSSGKVPKPPRLPAPPPPEETSTPGSKVVPKTLFQSARKELRKEKRTSAKAEAPPAKAQVSGDKKLKKKAKTGSSPSSKKRKIAPDNSETDVSHPPFEEPEWVPAAKHIPKKKKKKVVPVPSSESDSGKLPSDTVQDVKALATELAAGSKDGDEEKAIRAESAHASALEVRTVEPVKCSSTARLNRLNQGFTIFSFLQSLDQAQQ